MGITPVFFRPIVHIHSKTQPHTASRRDGEKKKLLSGLIRPERDVAFPRNYLRPGNFSGGRFSLKKSPGDEQISAGGEGDSVSHSETDVFGPEFKM